MTRTIQFPTARAFKPLLTATRYKGAYGGRGSGKSHFFAELLVEECLLQPGTRAVCIREYQKTLAQSSKHLIESKIEAYSVPGFVITKESIATPGGGAILFQGMQDHTAESIKSLEGCRIAWIEEAQTLSARSLSLLRPTIRLDGSEIWASWNPTRKGDPVDSFLRGGPDPSDPTKILPPPSNAIVVKANWRDNPWWNATLEAERKLELERFPDRYDHTYEGDYARAFEGAYFAGLLGEANRGGRIGAVAADPLLPLRGFIDIGGAGAQADAFACWIVQFVGQSIRILDYYESVGQVLGFHVQWLRDRGYEKAILRLPHDGVNANNITGKKYEDHLRDAGFRVDPSVPNQGRGAAAMRIEAVRRIFPKVWFNADTTDAGRTALGFYHERRDEQRKVGLGPEHDWSSHAADAFGLMAVCYESPERSSGFNRKIQYANQGLA